MSLKSMEERIGELMRHLTAMIATVMKSASDKQLWTLLSAIYGEKQEQFDDWILDDADYVVNLIEGQKGSDVLDKLRQQICSDCPDNASDPEPTDPGDTGND